MSLDELQSLADAAGYGAVFDEDIDLARSEPIQRDAKAGGRSQENWRFPDAPAPRTAVPANRSLVVVQPLWLSQPASPQSSSAWARHLQTASRGVVGLFASRGVPA